MAENIIDGKEVEKRGIRLPKAVIPIAAPMGRPLPHPDNALLHRRGETITAAPKSAQKREIVFAE